MDIKELKNSIENKTIDKRLLILRYSDTDFVALQYVDEIKKLRNCDITLIDDLNSVINNGLDIFNIQQYTDTLNLFFCETLNCNNRFLPKQADLIIICKNIEKDTLEIIKDFVVEIPKLEKWQIKDFAYSIAEGVDEKDLDNLLDVCKYDVNRVYQELCKINIFQQNQRKTLFKDFIDDDIFSDLSKETIFDFTNAIIKKDFNKISYIYDQLKNIDCEELGLVTILYNNFKNILRIQLNPTVKPESIGLTQKQFWAIKYNCNYYNKNQLMQIFDIVTDIDRKLKTGEIEVRYIIDYLVTSILCVK